MLGILFLIVIVGAVTVAAAAIAFIQGGTIGLIAFIITAAAALVAGSSIAGHLLRKER